MTSRPPASKFSSPRRKVSYALNVIMLATGRVSMCSDGERASKPVPGYDLCQVEEEG